MYFKQLKRNVFIIIEYLGECNKKYKRVKNCSIKKKNIAKYFVYTDLQSFIA